MEKRNDKMTMKCLTCKDEYCSKSLLNKLYCAVFTTRMLGKSFIKAVGLLLIAIAVPIVINIAYMIGSDTPNTIFAGYHLLAYAGACIFGLAVYWQTRRIHKKNQELQQRSARLENYNLQYNTFVYLNILRIETTADYSPLKTHTLINAVPWPLDVRATRYGYPNGMPQDFPKKHKKRLDKLIENDKKSYPNGLNSAEYEENIVKEKVMFGYTESFSDGTTAKCFPPIDPYRGVYYSGTNTELVLWQRDFPIPRLYRFYTPLTLNFFAVSSRVDFFVDVIETSNFELTLMSSEGKLYRFADNLSYFADAIREPVMIKTTTLAENSYYRNKYKCDHAFSIQLHLCHGYSELLKITKYTEADMKFDAVYINTFGVRTKRRHGFRIGAIVSEVKESQLLDSSGKPLKYRSKKKVNLQHYTTSDFSLDIDRSDYLVDE